MLGYRGRSNRRDFIGGWALLTVGPLPIALVIEPLMQWLRPFGVDQALAIAGILAAGVFSIALVAVWFWGATVLLTRRSRDIGWPAWSGLAGAALATAVASVFGVPVLFALLGVMAGVPGRRERTDADIRAGVFG